MRWRMQSDRRSVHLLTGEGERLYESRDVPAWMGMRCVQIDRKGEERVFLE